METRLEGTGAEIQRGLRPTIGAGIEWHEGGGRGGDIAAPFLSEAALEDLADEDVEDGIDEEETTGRFLHYQPWLTVTGKALEELADEVFAAIPPPATTPGRSLRKDATERRKKCLRNLLANLVVLGLSPVHQGGLIIATDRAKQTRYNKADFTLQVLHNMLLALEFLGIVAIEPGQAHRRCTTATLSSGFRATLLQRGVTMASIMADATGETIILRARGERGVAGVMLDYADTPESLAMRAEMQELNASLSAANVRIDGQLLPPFYMVRIFQENKDAPWSRHGRIYRAVHLELSKTERYRLSIGTDMELCDLDWSACFIRIAYAMAGKECPAGDPYAIPGLEAHRSIVKLVLNAMFFRRPPKPGNESQAYVPRLPKGTRQGLPDGWNGKRFLAAVSQVHAPIAHLFGKPDLGFDLMRAESDMMLAVLRELRLKGCIALPCHDGLLTAKRHQSLAMEVMRKVSLERLGVAIPVMEKPIWRPKGLTLC